MENFNPCGIGQNIDYDYDHDHDSEGRAEQIVIAVDTHDINITTGRRASGARIACATALQAGARPFW
ncbi:MAG: hypothetical protein ACOCUB_01765 [Desulfohalobiaceae bacterium]